jgi:hypothetical protein
MSNPENRGRTLRGIYRPLAASCRGEGRHTHTPHRHATATSARIDASLEDGAYSATPTELAGIDRGLRAARKGRFVTD